MNLRAMYRMIREIYKPRYVLLNLALILVYYYLYVALLKFQNNGVFISLLPAYLLYPLVISSAMTLTIAIYAVMNTRNNKAYISASATGTATAILGSVVSGCGCSFPVLFSLTSFGLNLSDIITINNFVNANQTGLFVIMIAINSFVMIYYLNKLAEPYCRIRKGKS